MTESSQQCLLAIMKPSTTNLWWKSNVPCEACWKFLNNLHHGVEACGDVSKGAMRDEGLTLHTTPEAHRQAVENGCPLCRWFWDLKLADSLEYLPDIQSFIAWGKKKGSNFLKLRYTIRKTLDVTYTEDGRKSSHIQSHMLTHESYLQSLNPAEERLRVQDYRPINSSSHSEILALAKNWLNICRGYHTKCLRPRTRELANWIPKRLVRIHPSNLHIRLVEGDEISPGTSYTTLSHCWGKVPERPCLTSSNIMQWKSLMPNLSEMKTLHDALAITVALDIHHIWIDSLCIKQDADNKDWREQSALMANIYKYSDCNITASAAQSDTEGCFFARRPGQRTFRRVVLPSLRPEMFDNFLNYQQAAEKEPSLGVYDIHDRYSGNGPDPVDKRGWVLQEVKTIYRHQKLVPSYKFLRTVFLYTEIISSPQCDLRCG
ncbi:heterokaryon incompatibility protein-domain-containing protein [Whalleya microplaca]|nr:heterokaryon incompatibility protein-domain-containing protein [Whalleya microplaca]